MERLTIRRDYGITMADGYDFGIDPDNYDLVQEILARLAAYEDTGLTPEEIKAMQHTMAEYHKEADPLLRAKAAGRLVVIPCRIEDYVYIPNLETSKVTRVRVQGISISLNGRPILRFGGYPFESAWGDRCGKDFFLTREEAEKALADINVGNIEGGKGDG